MRRQALYLAIVAIVGGAFVTSDALAAKKPKSPHKFKGNVELQFRSNTNIKVAPSSSDNFNFASFADFDAAAAKLGEDDEGEDDEDEGEDEGDDEGEGDDDFGDDSGFDDFDDLGLDDAFLSEEDFEFETDDDDGDGDEDDPDNDGIDDEDDDGDDDDGDDDDDETGSDASKRLVQDDDDLERLITQVLDDKMAMRSDKLNRWTGTVGFGHKYAFSNGMVVWGSSFRGAGDFHNGKDNLDKSNFAVSTGPEITWKDIGFKLKPAVSYLKVRQDGDTVVSTWVGTLATSYDFSKTFSVDGVYNYQDRDVQDPDSPDAIVNTLTFGAEWILSKNDIVKAKVSPKVEDSSQVTKNRDVTGFALSYSRKLPMDMILGIGFKQDSIDFKNLPNNREDDVRAFSINLAKEWTKSLESELAWERRELDSNINSKDAVNRSWLLGINYKF